MKTIIAYIIVYGSTYMGGEMVAKEIEEKVLKSIKQGYEPYGSISCVDSKGGFIKCYQPMVKYAESEEDK